MELMQALYHWARLGYYTTALDHVGHHHSDSAYITLCCIESQAVLERFLAGQQLTLDQEVRNQLHMNGRLAHLLILMSSWLTVISAIVILMWQR